MPMKYVLPTIFAATALALVWLFFSPLRASDSEWKSAPQARVVSPQTDRHGPSPKNDADKSEQLAFEDVSNAKIALPPNEKAVAVITQDFDGDPQDEQIIAIRGANENDGLIRLVYADFDDAVGGYKRVWEAPTNVGRSRTFSMFVKDLIGDRSLCVIANGMNDKGEQTMTVFRKKNAADFFDKIVDLHTDGSISVSERDRSQAYHLGMAGGASYKISIYGRDYESSNILDQIETIYDFDPTTNKYERIGVARIPGAQIEQRRVRQLLDGTPDRFERFLDGLWMFTPASSDSSVKQYINFDPLRREVIFYADDTQEVFSWENSNATRYGLYLTTKNISVTNLMRLIDIELESADSIRVRAFEDVKLKIGVLGRWDGTYRKLASAQSEDAKKSGAKQATRSDAEYEGSNGTLRLFADGKYEFGTETGIYSFFSLEKNEYLELRKNAGAGNAKEQAVYAVAKTNNELKLKKVRLTVHGEEDLHERTLVFKRVRSK